MSLAVVLAIAVLTYVSRAAALVLLPPPPPAAAAVLDRMPAPLFAGLAVLAVVGDDGLVTAPVTLAALAGALVAAPSRSMPIILAAGLTAAAVALAFT